MSNTYLQMMRASYPNFRDCTIQLFDDTKQGRDLARKIDQNKFSDEDLEKGLEGYNKKGAGIFFSINSMKPGERDKASVTKVNARACEVDNLSKEDQLKLISVAPLAPSLIIESHKSFHMYRFAKDGTIENWTKICRGLRNFFSGDPAIASDISRVLRVPGYNHMKDINNPFMCSITDGNGEYYTEEEMLKAFPDTETLSEKEQKAIKKEQQLKQAIGNDDARDRIRAMDSKAMLEKISGTSLVGGDIISFRHNSNGTEQICCNGKTTGCRIDRGGKIGSTDKGGPNRTNWIAWYGGVDWKEIFHWIKEEFPFILPEKKTSLERAQNFSKEVLPDASGVISEEERKPFTMGEKTPFTWGLSSLDNKFGKIDYHRFIVAVGESGAGKTEYTLFQARKNADLGHKVCYISLEMGKAGLIERQCMKRAGVDKPQWDARDLSPNQLDIMREMQQKLWNYPNLDIIGLKDTSLAGLLSAIRYKEKEGYVLFYIDNMGFIKGENEDELETTKLASRELKTLTNELKISIVLLHHFNKGNSMERYAPRGKASIRGSGKIENDADYIFQVYRDFENGTNVAQILLEKDRIRGEPATVPIKFVKGDYEDINDGF